MCSGSVCFCKMPVGGAVLYMYFCLLEVISVCSLCTNKLLLHTKFQIGYNQHASTAQECLKKKNFCASGNVIISKT